MGMLIIAQSTHEGRWQLPRNISEQISFGKLTNETLEEVIPMLGECVVGTSQWAKYDDNNQLKSNVRYIWLPS